MYVAHFSLDVFLQFIERVHRFFNFLLERIKVLIHVVLSNAHTLDYHLIP